MHADEIRLKAVGGVFWLASAMEVRSRLWLGSVISQHRDGRLIGGLLIRVRACGPVEKILLVTDGLSSYKSQGQNNKGRLGRTHSRPPGWKVGPFDSSVRPTLGAQDDPQEP